MNTRIAAAILAVIFLFAGAAHAGSTGTLYKIKIDPEANAIHVSAYLTLESDELSVTENGAGQLPDAGKRIPRLRGSLQLRGSASHGL